MEWGGGGEEAEWVRLMWMEEDTKGGERESEHVHKKITSVLDKIER